MSNKYKYATLVRTFGGKTYHLNNLTDLLALRKDLGITVANNNSLWTDWQESKFKEALQKARDIQLESSQNANPTLDLQAAYKYYTAIQGETIANLTAFYYKQIDLRNLLIALEQLYVLNLRPLVSRQRVTAPVPSLPSAAKAAGYYDSKLSAGVNNPTVKKEIRTFNINGTPTDFNINDKNDALALLQALNKAAGFTVVLEDKIWGPRSEAAYRSLLRTNQEKTTSAAWINTKNHTLDNFIHKYNGKTYGRGSEENNGLWYQYDPSTKSYTSTPGLIERNGLFYDLNNQNHLNILKNMYGLLSTNNITDLIASYENNLRQLAGNALKQLDAKSYKTSNTFLTVLKLVQDQLRKLGAWSFDEMEAPITQSIFNETGVDVTAAPDKIDLASQHYGPEELLRILDDPSNVKYRKAYNYLQSAQQQLVNSTTKDRGKVGEFFTTMIKNTMAGALANYLSNQSANNSSDFAQLVLAGRQLFDREHLDLSDNWLNAAETSGIALDFIADLAFTAVTGGAGAASFSTTAARLAAKKAAQAAMREGAAKGLTKEALRDYAVNAAKEVFIKEASKKPMQGAVIGSGDFIRSASKQSNYGQDVNYWEAVKLGAVGAVNGALIYNPYLFEFAPKFSNLALGASAGIGAYDNTKTAISDFEEGNIGRGIGHTALASLDLVGTYLAGRGLRAPSTLIEVLGSNPISRWYYQNFKNPFLEAGYTFKSIPTLMKSAEGAMGKTGAAISSLGRLVKGTALIALPVLAPAMLTYETDFFANLGKDRETGDWHPTNIITNTLSDLISGDSERINNARMGLMMMSGLGARVNPSTYTTTNPFINLAEIYNGIDLTANTTPQMWKEAYEKWKQAGNETGTFDKFKDYVLSLGQYAMALQPVMHSTGNYLSNVGRRLLASSGGAQDFPSAIANMKAVTKDYKREPLKEQAATEQATLLDNALRLLDDMRAKGASLEAIDTKEAEFITALNAAKRASDKEITKIKDSFWRGLSYIVSGNTNPLLGFMGKEISLPYEYSFGVMTDIPTANNYKKVSSNQTERNAYRDDPKYLDAVVQAKVGLLVIPELNRTRTYTDEEGNTISFKSKAPDLVKVEGGFSGESYKTPEGLLVAKVFGEPSVRNRVHAGNPRAIIDVNHASKFLFDENGQIKKNLEIFTNTKGFLPMDKGFDDRLGVSSHRDIFSGDFSVNTGGNNAFILRDANTGKIYVLSMDLFGAGSAVTSGGGIGSKLKSVVNNATLRRVTPELIHVEVSNLEDFRFMDLGQNAANKYKHSLVALRDAIRNSDDYKNDPNFREKMDLLFSTKGPVNYNNAYIEDLVLADGTVKSEVKGTSNVPAEEKLNEERKLRADLEDYKLKVSTLEQVLASNTSTVEELTKQHKKLKQLQTKDNKEHILTPELRDLLDKQLASIETTKENLKEYNELKARHLSYRVLEAKLKAKTLRRKINYMAKSDSNVLVNKDLSAIARIRDYILRKWQNASDFEDTWNQAASKPNRAISDNKIVLANSVNRADFNNLLWRAFNFEPENYSLNNLNKRSYEDLKKEVESRYNDKQFTRFRDIVDSYSVPMNFSSSSLTGKLKGLISRQKLLGLGDRIANGTASEEDYRTALFLWSNGLTKFKIGGKILYFK